MARTPKKSGSKSRKKNCGQFDFLEYVLDVSNEEYVRHGFEVVSRSPKLVKAKGKATYFARLKLKLGFGARVTCPYGCIWVVDDDGNQHCAYRSPDCSFCEVEEGRFDEVSIEEVSEDEDEERIVESSQYEMYDMNPHFGLGKRYRESCGCRYEVMRRKFRREVSVVGVCIGMCTEHRRDFRSNLDY